MTKSRNVSNVSPELNLSLDDLPWPSLAVDATGQILYANEEMRNRAVMPRCWQNRPLAELFPEYAELLAEDHPPASGAAIVSRRTDAGSIQERVWLRAMPGWTCLIVIDETRLAELEAARDQTARLASMGFLLAGVCHEVGNPLAAMHSMIQILQSPRGMNAATVKKGLPILAANVKRMLEITRKLSNFSRAMTDKRRVLPVDRPIENALALVRHDPLAANVDIQHQPLPAATVRAHASELQQVFFNIFLNAIQAMGGKGSLRVETSMPDAGTVLVSVKDSGPGIPPENLPSVLEPFFTTKPSGEGTGLGLAISDQIVQEHGGRIHVENLAGGGACFGIQIPRCESQ